LSKFSRLFARKSIAKAILRNINEKLTENWKKRTVSSCFSISESRYTGIYPTNLHKTGILSVKLVRYILYASFCYVTNSCFQQNLENKEQHKMLGLTLDISSSVYLRNGNPKTGWH
jgi:hypothetical protein